MNDPLLEALRATIAHGANVKRTMAGVIHRWGPGKLWAVLTEDGDLDVFTRAETEEQAIAAAELRAVIAERAAVVEYLECRANHIAQTEIARAISATTALLVAAKVIDAGAHHPTKEPA